MSSGGGAAAAGGGGSGRVSIPSNVRKTIQNIKEITGNHSEEDIYAMLKECSMDPNETTDKLLLQDTFHEVKRKRDKRKENLNKEPAESRWKPAMQGRGSRGARGSSSSRNNFHDADGGRNLALGKENGPSQGLEKGVNISSLTTAQETKSKEAISAGSSSTANANGPTVVASANIAVTHDSNSSTDSAAAKSDEVLLAPTDSKKNSVIACGSEEQSRQQASGTSSSTAVQSPGPHFSPSDPLLLPLQDSRHPNAVGTIRREVGSQHTSTEQMIPSNSDKNKPTSAASDSKNSIVQGKLPSKVHGVGKNHHLESSQNSTSVHASSSVSRPSSNYNNRSQVIGPQKVGPNMEWKPKPANPNLAHGSGAVASSEAPADANLQPKSNSLDSKEANVELQRKLEELHMSDGQYVIIPNHLHVPEADKLGFCFGSFDAVFGINTSHNGTPESDQSALSETTDGIEDAAEEQFSSNQNTFATEEVDYPDNNQSASYNAENLSSNEGGVSSSSVAESNEPKQETTPGGNQYSVAHTSPNYNFGFMQPIAGNQLSPFEGSEPQVRDVSRLPTFVVQQPFDPTNFYAQFYRSGAETDGRISPFHSAGVSTKYNGNLAVVSPQTSQSAQEGSPIVLSTAAPTPLVNQATGVLQNSMAVTQQPLSVFRPPTGLHLPHYPPNYIPYGHYFPPFYVPPPAIHQFLSNGAFPQQPQGGSVYPTPPAAAAKYSLPQYKPGTHTNNSTHVGVPGNYGPYGSSMTAGAGNSTSNEDLAAFKESNTYGSVQQSEGSGVWIAPSGRDISSLQASSFYSLSQGQMAFAPAQPSHGTFASVYHPAQPVNATAVHPLLQQSQAMAGPVDMGGPTANVYQQPQHSQMNWPSNF